MTSTRSHDVIEEMLQLDDLEKTVNGNYPLLWHCTLWTKHLSPAIMERLIDQTHVRFDGTLPIDIGENSGYPNK